MDNRGIDTDPGWVNRQLRELRLAIEALRSERRASATEVSEGDFVVSGGGSIRVEDGGDLRTYHANDAVALALGGLTTGGGNPGEGLILRDPNGLIILSGYSDNVNGERVVLLGHSGVSPLELLQVISERITLNATSGPVSVSSTNGDITLDANVGDIRLQVDAGRRVFVGHETTAAAANCFINTDGSIWRSTSSRRYKQDERPADIDTAAVLALQPRVFRSRAEVEALGDDAPTHAGFVAEEAAELGLDHWVTRDEDGQPEAFAYAQFCVAQQAVIQAQQAQIDDLAAKVAALTKAAPQATRPTSNRST